MRYLEKKLDRVNRVVKIRYRKGVTMDDILFEMYRELMAMCHETGTDRDAYACWLEYLMDSRPNSFIRLYGRVCR